MNYSNNQSNKTENFIWKKKLDKQGLNELDSETRKNILDKKRHETLIELEKVKQRRKEREKELFLKQNEKDEQLRKKEQEYYEHYKSKEKEFEYLKAKERSRIRIKNGRQQPIDLLASFIHEDILQGDGTDISEDLSLKVKMIEPIKLVNELNLEDLENLKYDIQLYTKFDIEKNLCFWNDLLCVIEQKISDKKCEDKHLPAKSWSRHAVEHSNQKATIKDIEKIFNGKTIDQLKILQTQVNEKCEKLKQSNMDTSYWESVLKRLKVRISALSTTERYKKIFEGRIIKKHTQNSHTKGDKTDNDFSSDLHTFHVEELVKSTQREPYMSECYSPILVSFSKLNKNIDVFDRETYYRELNKQQDYILNGSKVADDKKSIKLYNEEMCKKMEEDEEEFNQESFIQDQDKNRIATHYTLIKPKYFNKINTGFEWNKYNQTHYDVDNPPPKIIQGYKFNIFYPNLLDPTKTPSYSVTACPDNPDYNIIKFSGGPPYEDIAFKIVDGEWDVGDHSNLVCQFENGVFQLWFQFRKYKYRR